MKRISLIIISAIVLLSSTACEEKKDKAESVLPGTLAPDEAGRTLFGTSPDTGAEIPEGFLDEIPGGSQLDPKAGYAAENVYCPRICASKGRKCWGTLSEAGSETEALTEAGSSQAKETTALGKNETETVQSTEASEETSETSAPETEESSISNIQTAAETTRQEAAISMEDNMTETQVAEPQTSVTQGRRPLAAAPRGQEEAAVNQDGRNIPDLESGCINDGLFY